MAEFVFGWIIFAAVVVGVSILSLFIVKYYNDPFSSRPFPTIVTTIGLSLVLLTCFLIPVDIWAISSLQDGLGNFIVDATARNNIVTGIEILYAVMYGLCLFCAFIMIPFAYFFFEADDDFTTWQKMLSALKYTIFTLVLFVALLIVGLVLTPGIEDDIRSQNFEWIKELFVDNSRGMHAITFCVASLGLLGLITYIIYTGFGFAAFPIGLIKGRKDVDTEHDEVAGELAKTRARRSMMETRFSLTSGRQMSKKDRIQLDDLKRRERELETNDKKLGKTTFMQKCKKVLRPFTFLFGIIYLLFALLLVTSTTITAVDKLLNSACGPGQPVLQCGYILNHPALFNPFDKLLTLLTPVFPLDLIMIGLAIFYVFQASLSGIARLGIRILWIRFFKIRPRRTPPQALLLGSVLLMMVMLIMNMQILTLAPQYATFGSQHYNIVSSVDNSTILAACTVDAGPGNCTMSGIATIVNRINVQMPFFGVVYFWSNWVFLLIFLISLIVVVVRKAPSNIDSDSEQEIQHHAELLQDDEV